MNKPLLSITIPTYNRAKYLSMCLAQIFKQCGEYSNIIEIIVSDNCSTDNTETIINSYKNEGKEILYIKNDKNLGIDGNIEQCFTLAKGKYVWIFGDDDLLLDGAFSNIIKLLKEGEYGNIFLSNYWYIKDYIVEMPSCTNRFDFTVFDNKESYCKKVNYWVTFCSGNITNKEILPYNFNSKKYLGTELTLVHWILTASLSSKRNVYIDSYVLACKAGNSVGNYKLFQVFGEYLRKISSDIFHEYNISPNVLKHIDNCLLVRFFPMFLVSYKRKQLTVFEKENPMSVLYKEYKGNPVFWLVDYPLFYLPKGVDIFYLKIIRKVFKFWGGMRINLSNLRF